jgi:hypothetical protein
LRRVRAGCSATSTPACDESAPTLRAELELLDGLLDKCERPKLTRLLCSFLQNVNPGFALSTLQVNPNFEGHAHRDQNNAAPSVIPADVTSPAATASWRALPPEQST